MQLQLRPAIRRLVRISAISFLFYVGPALASTFEAGVIGTACIGVALGPAPASGSWTNSTNGTGTADADAFALGGWLGGSATASSTGNAAAFNHAGACHKAQIVIDDIIISGPGSEVSTQVSAHFEGTLDPVQGGGVAVAQASARIRAQTAGGGALSSYTYYNTGSVIAPVAVDTILTTPSFLAPVGVPFAVRMYMESDHGVQDNFSPGSATSASDFSNTLSFIEGAPVFDLPAGYTVNSIDGNIVDNQFVGGATQVPALGGSAHLAIVVLFVGISTRALGRRRFRHDPGSEA
jgi:hypothetical protein